MDQQRLAHLLEKYNAGTCSPQELAALEDWYAKLGSEKSQPTGTEQPATELLADFKRRLPLTATPVRRLRPVHYLRIAAGLVLGIALAAVFFRYNHTKTPAEAGSKPVRQLVNATHNRFLELPDGTRVILKEGSKLAYTGTFNGSRREVSLTGEAYFDVKHDAARPFIIHTGTVQTRVLGTAFNIRAYPAQPSIVVTVTRGKVQVTEKARTLAVLTPNKQVTFNKAAETAVRQDIEAQAAVRWVKQNLAFENAGFGQIVSQLAERYQVPIRTEENLQKCPTTISFSGAETLEEALNILCLTRTASFKKSANGYTITGEGCTPN